MTAANRPTNSADKPMSAAPIMARLSDLPPPKPVDLRAGLRGRMAFMIVFSG